jgi:ATP-dependent helicase/DNAse subunit B
MRLLTGPAGSGKTYTVLQEFRQALRQSNRDARLLVPTTTMARFVRNLLAREGFVFPAEQVSTFSRFLEPFAPDVRAVSEPLLYLIVEQAAAEIARPEFARVAGMAGFSAALARTINEFSSAGCSAERLERHLPDTPLGEAFLAVYRAVERELAARGLCLRGERLERVGAAIKSPGAIWMDGFYSITDPELAIVTELARKAPMTVTLATAGVTQPARERLLRAGFREERLAYACPPPSATLVEAASIERECDEIARRIVEHATAGRDFRDMGIIVRAPEVYEGPLRAALERFGVPARFYFERPLLEVASAAYVAAAVEAALSGWDHERSLVWLRTAPNGTGAPLDWFDFEIRRNLPGRGLDPLFTYAAGNPNLLWLLDSAKTLDGWREGLATAAEWAERMDGAAGLYYAPRPREGATHEEALAWREQAKGLAAFRAAMGEAVACFLPAARIGLAEFWRAASAALRLSVVRVDDLRRNVVNVLTAYEARQWRLPVVFVCGLVEKQFPGYQTQNPFFPDAARRPLQQAGIRLRTTADMDEEEAFLFDSAVSRAAESLVLSYPKADSRGEQNLRSLLLDRLAPLAVECARTAIPRRAPAAAPRRNSPVSSPSMLERLAGKHAKLKPSALEFFVQCPFRFFASYTLRLKPVPPRPGERLDFAVKGTLMHQAVAEWSQSREDIDALFARLFEEAVRTHRIVPGHRTESARRAMLRDLRRFTADTQWPGGFDSSVELDFEAEIEPGLFLRGRIDRLDRTPDGRAYIIDYKYSRKDYSRNELHLQGPLYLLAAKHAFGLEPGGMFYCKLRDEVRYSGWSDDQAPLAGRPITAEWLENAAAVTRETAASIRAGRVEPAPADTDVCRYCDYRDVCRIESIQPAALSEGGRS